MQKIVVIGGGPAGLSAAIEGAKTGLKVTLYEKNKLGENINCAEGFFDTLNIFGEPKYGVLYKVRQIDLQLKSCYSFPCDSKINIWMLDKGQWQKGLANEARGLGVNIIENYQINKEILKRIISENDWVIDATGAESLTSKALKFNNYSSVAPAVAVQYTLEGDFRNLSGKFKIGLEENIKGYYWIFPKTNNLANVGIGLLENTKKNLWGELEKILQKEGIDLYKRLKKIGGICPIKKLDRLVYDNVILVGDSAGLVSPLHGAGIDTSCVSGKIAIQSIVNNKVESYENMIDAVLGSKLKQDKIIFELWMNLEYNHIENVIKFLSSNRITKYNISKLFNGNLKLLKHDKLLNFIMSTYGLPLHI
ncbi:MAG: NAD(P)/FAD-dependent oxidoreductase [Vulcanibacillus sp.]